MTYLPAVEPSMEPTRREFLQWLIAFFVAIGIRVPAFEKRTPYVKPGAVVSYVGPSPGFTGGQLVREIGEWDGIGYPVTVKENCYCTPVSQASLARWGHQPHQCHIVYYDFDLVDFNEELPPRFWHDPENRRRYPNVHTYIRVKRFGETVEQAIVAKHSAHWKEWAAMAREGVPFHS